ncbi:hypothetical protein BO94DRAFT_309580 [Aspergillus sclerotioniger CBS 115572]|uniref:Uncharacterized protein n=1 Tax=Aspergillus sclerotioniger CBS 115572 TaxID=1450535 RepID=A0A317V1K2_9EURO|nr:hypothetical protein BO94DRAFT_309580 [Aspergillus sclerotioniger CBS 115572]PWY67271.1 hypothetical protein BO94DRAFT_309580 [Aspergillus sclerotioniger CBS 115572]
MHKGAAKKSFQRSIATFPSHIFPYAEWIRSSAGGEVEQSSRISVARFDSPALDISIRLVACLCPLPSGVPIVRRKQPQLSFSTATTGTLSDYPFILIFSRRHPSFSTAHLFSERFLVANRLHDTLIHRHLIIPHNTTPPFFGIRPIARAVYLGEDGYLVYKKRGKPKKHQNKRHFTQGENKHSLVSPAPPLSVVRLVSFVTYLTFLVPQQIHTEQEEKKLIVVAIIIIKNLQFARYIFASLPGFPKEKNHSGLYSHSPRSLEGFSTCHFSEQGRGDITKL